VTVCIFTLRKRAASYGVSNIDDRLYLHVNGFCFGIEWRIADFNLSGHPIGCIKTSLLISPASLGSGKQIKKSQITG
jgi:hypothetical protein